MLELEQKHGKECKIYMILARQKKLKFKFQKKLMEKKIVEIQDGEYYLGEKLISDTQQRNIIFHELNDRVVDDIWNILLDRQHSNQETGTRIY